MNEIRYGMVWRGGRSEEAYLERRCFSDGTFEYQSGVDEALKRAPRSRGIAPTPQNRVQGGFEREQ